MVTAVIAVVAVLVISLAVVGRVRYARTHAANANGTYALQFVWVEDDGTARSLTTDEIEYLNTEFLPGDGARPYIKPTFEARTPDGRIGGFLLAKKLPSHITVKS